MGCMLPLRIYPFARNLLFHFLDLDLLSLLAYNYTLPTGMRFVAILYYCGEPAASPGGRSALVAAVAPGCARVRLCAGPSGLAAMALGRAGGRSGMRAGWCLPPEKAVFLVQDWESNAFGLLLILADNYNLTTNNFTTETQSAQRTHRDFLAEQSAASCRL